jgi:hypothetical protein
LYIFRIVPRFRLIQTPHSERRPHINNGFIRVLALESIRLGADLPLTVMLPTEGPSVRERYAPMHRLLTQEDELFLKKQGLAATAKKLRREHRICYFNYLARLAREIRMARQLHGLAMASTEHWSFGTLTAEMVLSEFSLLYLRWLGYRHAAGINVAARDVTECLDFLLGASKFHLATT